MPRMRQRCVRPRIVSDGSTGISRTIRQAILLVPTSSTDRMVLLRAERGLRRGGIRLRSRLSGFAARALAAERVGALRGGFFGEARDEAVRLAQIERDHILFEDARIALERVQRGERGVRILLRQHDLDAACGAEAPAPFADKNTGADFRPEVAGLG